MADWKPKFKDLCQKTHTEQAIWFHPPLQTQTSFRISTKHPAFSGFANQKIKTMLKSNEVSPHCGHVRFLNGFWDEVEAEAIWTIAHQVPPSRMDMDSSTSGFFLLFCALLPWGWGKGIEQQVTSSMYKNSLSSVKSMVPCSTGVNRDSSSLKKPILTSSNHTEFSS